MQHATRRMLAFVAINTALLTGVSSAAQATEATTFEMNHHFFLGKWDCVGEISVPHKADKIPTVGRLSIHKKGKLIVDHFQNYTPSGHKFGAIGWSHYDDLTNEIVRHGVARGGVWSRAVSAGWKGDDFTWEGKLSRFGHKEPIWVNDNIHKTSDTSFKWTVDVAFGDSGWNTMYTGTCNKVSHHGHGHSGSSDGSSGSQGSDGDDSSDQAGSDTGADNDATESDSDNDASEPEPSAGHHGGNQGGLWFLSH